MIFMLNITLTTWRFMFLENILNRANVMAVTQVESGIFPPLLPSTSLPCGLILLSDASPKKFEGLPFIKITIYLILLERLFRVILQ